MHQAISRIVSSTSIEHVVTGQFLSRETNLVTAGSNSLRIYGLNGSKLVLVKEYNVEGIIMGLGKISFVNHDPLDEASSDSLDLLMVSFESAKCSVMKYDHDLDNLVTISLHDFEKPEFKSQSSSPQFMQPGLRRDDVHKYCAFLVENHYLALVSFRNSVMSRVIRCTDIDTSIVQVFDIQFLLDYHEPTLSILYETKPTCTGRLMYEDRTKKIVILSVDMGNERLIILNRMDNLVHDSHKLYPLKNKYCQLVVVGVNSLTFVDRNFNEFSLEVNPFQKGPAFFSKYASLGITLEGSMILQLFPDVSDEECHILVSLKSGNLYYLRLVFSLARVLEEYSIEQVGHFHGTVAELVFVDSYIFMATFNGSSSVLLEYSFENASTEAWTFFKLVPNRWIRLRVVDMLHQVGLVQDIVVSRNTELSQPEFVGINECKEEIVSIRQTISARIIASLPLSSMLCDSLWQLEVQNRDSWFTYLAVSSENSTLVLQSTERDVKEVEVSDFYLEGRTLAMGLICCNRQTSIIQVSSENVRFLDPFGVLISSVANGFGTKIVDAWILDPVLLVLHEDETARLYTVSPGTMSLEVEWTQTTTATLFRYGHVGYCALVNASGQLSIYQLGSYEPVFQNSDFHDMKDVVVNGQISDSQVPIRHGVDELAAVENCFGDLFLMVRLDTNDVVIYHTPFVVSGFSRLIRLAHSIVFYSETNTLDRWTRISKTLIPFDAIQLNRQTVKGMFALGKQSYWIFFTEQSRLPVMLPNETKHGVIRGFCSFNSSLCPFGFGYINETHKLMLGIVPNPKDGDLDTLFVPQLCASCMLTVKDIEREHRRNSHVAFHGDSSTLIVASYSGVPFSIPPEDHVLGTESSADKINLPPVSPLMYQYQIHLLSSVHEYKLMDSHQLQPYETVVSCTVQRLSTKQNSLGYNNYLVVGTNYLRGEDRPSRGRVLVFEIVKIVDDADNPHLSHKLKLAHEEECKGPVSCVSSVLGYLLVAMGCKIVIYSFAEGDDLEGVAFLDLGIYTLSCSVIKNFILAGDVYKSVQFLVFQEDPPKLMLLGKDFVDVPISATGFVIHAEKLGLVAGDRERNMHVYYYNPFDSESFGGQKLLHKCDVFVGSIIHRLFRFSIDQNAQGCIYACVDGSFGAIVPIDERRYKRLHSLYLKLQSQTVLVGGLNHRSHRLATYSTSLYKNTKRAKSIVDLTFIVSAFNNLSVERRDRMARSIGTTVSKVYQDLDLFSPPL